jgi:hypothetical protein
VAESQGAKENRQQAAIPDLSCSSAMVAYGLALGNQRQLNGGDFSTRTDELWPAAARRGQLSESIRRRQSSIFPRLTLSGALIHVSVQDDFNGRTLRILDVQFAEPQVLKLPYVATRVIDLKCAPI